jgi:Flp pilus assembly protein TadD
MEHQVEEEPTDSGAHNVYGLALEGQGLLSAAEREFATARKLVQFEVSSMGDATNTKWTISAQPTPRNRKEKSILLNHVRVLMSMKRFDEALGEIAKNMKEVEKEPQVWNLLGMAYFHQKKFDKSVECYEKALQFSEEEKKKKVLVNLTQVHYNAGNIDKAKAAIFQW